jgi:hypothetical protein
MGLTIEVVARRKGLFKSVVRRRLAPVEQFRFTFDQRKALAAALEQPAHTPCFLRDASTVGRERQP